MTQIPCDYCCGGACEESDPDNIYWNNICKIAQRQRNKGLDTYGQGLEGNTKPGIIERISYYQEELIDALMYSEWIKDAIFKEKK